MRSPLETKNNSKPITIDDLPQIHHELMTCYGWIPLEEFKELPIKTLLVLHQKVQEHKKQEYDYRKSVLKGLGYKIR